MVHVSVNSSNIVIYYVLQLYKVSSQEEVLSDIWN